MAVVEPPPAADEDFSFTIAIGRNAATREESRMVIDVSLPPAAEPGFEQTPSANEAAEQEGLYPVASIDERRIAGLIRRRVPALRLWRLSHVVWLARRTIYAQQIERGCVRRDIRPLFICNILPSSQFLAARRRA